jgi:hypothetical protein
MAIKNYEVRASIETDHGTSTNVLLGEAEIDDNKLSGNQQAFLKPFAQSRFAGEIGRIGVLNSVSVTERPMRNQSSTRKEDSNNSSSGKIKLSKVFIGLGLIIFVYVGFYMWDIIKSVYWNAPKKAWQWYKNFIHS